MGPVSLKEFQEKDFTKTATAGGATLGTPSTKILTKEWEASDLWECLGAAISLSGVCLLLSPLGIPLGKVCTRKIVGTLRDPRLVTVYSRVVKVRS